MITCEHDGGFSLDTSVRIEAQERRRHLDPEHLVYESKKPGPGGKVSVRLTSHPLLDRL